MNRLREYDLVTVTLPEDDARLRNACFDCHVVAIVGATAALEAVERSQVVWLPERVEGAFMSYRHDDKLVGLKGVLTTKEDVGDLRFTVVDGVQQRRRSASQLDICAPVLLKRPGVGQECDGVTMNVSADGLLVESDLDATVGEQLELVLSLPGDDEPVQAVATVVRLNSGLVAVQLGHTERVARGRLGSFVLEHNRATLRRSRLGFVEAQF